MGQSPLQKEADRRRKWWSDRAYKGKRYEPQQLTRPILDRYNGKFPTDDKLRRHTIEASKAVVCRVQHPSQNYQYAGAEFRLSVVPWSRARYVDIRLYYDGKPSTNGIFLHQDILQRMLPALIHAQRMAEMLDEREEDQKANPVVVETLDAAG